MTDRRSWPELDLDWGLDRVCLSVCVWATNTGFCFLCQRTGPGRGEARGEEIKAACVATEKRIPKSKGKGKRRRKSSCRVL